MNQTVILTNEQNKVFKKLINDAYVKTIINPKDIREIKIDQSDKASSDYHIWVFNTRYCGEFFRLIASQVDMKLIHPAHQYTSVHCEWDFRAEEFMCIVDVYPKVNTTLPIEPIQTTKGYLSLQYVFGQLTTE